MKASELITKLVELIAEDGDQEVRCFNLYDKNMPIDLVEPWSEGNDEFICIGKKYE